jgi:tripartite-type tricarboxylate transporter receptor subunit TctC
MNVPTVAEAGMPELDASIWFGLMAPAGTPRDVVDKLSRTLNVALKSERLLGQFKKMGYEPLGGSAEDFSHYVDAELRKWTAAAEAAGVRK